MAYETDFNDIFPDSVVRKAYASIDGYGKASYSTAAGTTYHALIQYKQKLIRAMDGTEKVSSTNVILACTGTINAQDKLTLPDGTSPPILSIGKVSDDEGQHHTRVYFG